MSSKSFAAVMSKPSPLKSCADEFCSYGKEDISEDDQAAIIEFSASTDMQSGIPGSGPDWQPDEWLLKLDMF